MSFKSIKAKFASLIEDHQDVDPYELRRIFTEAIREWESNQGWDQCAKGESWTDNQLRTVLADAPTKENCLKHARAFSRGYGAVEQIYRWAATPGPDIDAKGRGEDAFIKQVKRVAKQLGWRA